MGLGFKITKNLPRFEVEVEFNSKKHSIINKLKRHHPDIKYGWF